MKKENAKKNLVIVESPAKAKTINKFLGKNFIVKASMGHIRDLPASRFGIEVEKNFEPTYVILPNKKEVVKKLKNEAKKADKVYLAPDPDREGEAIAWHLSQILEKPQDKIFRVVFNEITKQAVIDAFKNPGKLDENKINSQQARRLLDRIVGYKISPFLWRKVAGGLSAGRVQSVAVKLICDREKEIQEFVPKEYWTIKAKFSKNETIFTADLSKIKKKKPEISDKNQAKNITEKIKKQKTYNVSSINETVKTKKPLPPFITSTLQQTAGTKLKWGVTKTMKIAQQLYEGIDLGEKGITGLITYMRTDSVRISKEFQKSTLEYIKKTFGKDYVPEKANTYKTKKGAQDAHEAIRPTLLISPNEIKEYLNSDQYQLYNLIWQRYLSSQMTHLKYKVITAEITGGEFTFTTSATKIIFDGYTKIYNEDTPNEDKTNAFPNIKQGDTVEIVDVLSEQHFTKPPARYTEATLVKALEEKGIGRPSTYAPIIQTIIKRNYVKKQKGKLYPTELGKIVTELLEKTFKDIIDVEFTAEMEKKLDEIESGKRTWTNVLEEFYFPFMDHLVKVLKTIKGPREKPTETDIVCEKCGKKMVIRRTKNGEFLACSGFPKCKNIKDFYTDKNGNIIIDSPQEIDKNCPQCGKKLIIKNGKYGKFLACENYPTCKYTETLPTGIKCPKCGGDIVKRFSKKGKVFFGCSNYPTCNYMSNSVSKIKEDIEKKNGEK